MFFFSILFTRFSLEETRSSARAIFNFFLWIRVFFSLGSFSHFAFTVISKHIRIRYNSKLWSQFHNFRAVVLACNRFYTHRAQTARLWTFQFYATITTNVCTTSTIFHLNEFEFATIFYEWNEFQMHLNIRHLQRAYMNWRVKTEQRQVTCVELNERAVKRIYYTSNVYLWAKSINLEHVGVRQDFVDKPKSNILRETS